MTSKAVLDRIYSLYIIPDAYRRWRTYREQLTDYVICNTLPGKTIAILGAGASDDMDLSRLYCHSGSLILADKDIDAMLEAVEKYGLGNRKDVQLVETDFLGITDEVYLNMISICKTDMEHMAFSMERTAEKLIDYLSGVLEPLFADGVRFGFDSCDYLVSVGLHSQLSCLMMQIWDIFRNMNEVPYADRSSDAVEVFLKRYNDRLIPFFCDALRKHAGEGLIIGVEDRVNNSVSPVQGAFQTIDYLMHSHRITQDAVTFMEWPFREGITYTMRLCSIMNDRMREE